MSMTAHALIASDSCTPTRTFSPLETRDVQPGSPRPLLPWIGFLRQVQQNKVGCMQNPRRRLSADLSSSPLFYSEAMTRSLSPYLATSTEAVSVTATVLHGGWCLFYALFIIVVDNASCILYSCVASRDLESQSIGLTAAVELSCLLWLPRSDRLS